MTWLKRTQFFALFAGTAVLLSACSSNPEAREADKNRVTPIASGPAPLERVVPREISNYSEEKPAEREPIPRAETAATEPNPAPTKTKNPVTTPRRAPARQTPKAETRYVNATTLNVRSGADSSASVRDQLPRNATVTVTSERTDSEGQKWSLVEYQDNGRNLTGWVATNYLSATLSVAPPRQTTPARTSRSSSAGSLKKTSFYKPAGDYFEQFERLDYKPVPKPSYPGNPKINAKGVYVSLNVLSSDRFDTILELVETTEINALVIDFKDDIGWLLTKSPTAEKLVPSANAKAKYDDISDLIKKLKAKNIYLIARIVTFKDPMFAKAHPESAIINNTTGKPFKSGDGLAWSSPYDPKFRAYNIGVAKEAAQAGFNEIQFDYVRFPDVSRRADLNYRNKTGEIKAEAIQSFLIEARAALKPYNVYVAADVFAWITTAVDDVRIGQYWEAISNVVDYICPMMYPSHYHKDAYGLRDPNDQPYELIRAGLNDAQLRDTALDPPAIIRPWLQGFSYTPAQVKAQIRAAQELGVTSYLIWHASGNYNPAAYR